MPTAGQLYKNGTMTVADELDLVAYFRRIGYSAQPKPDLHTLRDITGLHSSAIAFENLNPFLGEPVVLDLGAVQDKLVNNRRGGYCFEQNLLLRAVLLHIGFDVTALAARVLWGAPTTAISPRSHMLLRVAIDNEPWIVDVGFGGLTLTGAIRLEVDTEQPTPHEPFRLIDLDGDYAMQARLGGEWRTTYRFDLQRQYPVDYVSANWYLSTSPASHFVNGLMVARPAADRRFALGGRELAVHHLDGPTERRTLSTAAELIGALQRDFLLELPDWTPLEKAYDRLP